MNYGTVPSIVYTHPEVAWVGLTEAEVKASGVEYNVGKFSMMANSRARSVDDSAGVVSASPGGPMMSPHTTIPPQRLLGSCLAIPPLR